MRTVTSGQLSDMAAAVVVHHLRVEVMNADGVFKDLTSLGGVDWVDSVTIDAEALDTQVSKATVLLRREITGGVTSLAPLVTASTLNVYSGGYAPLLDVGRQVRISVAVVLPGVTPGVGDWKELWLGRINNVQWASDPVTVECSDLGAWLMDTQIETANVYGSSGGVALETVIQSIINDWPSGVLAPTLYTPASPGWMLHAFTQDRVHVFEAILALAQQIGYDIRYRYDASDNCKLTLFAPARSKTTADATIGPAQYTDVSKLTLAIDDIRNVVNVVYTLASGSQDTQTASDSGSITHFGRRFLETMESATGNIDTAAEALALALAMVHDLAQPIAEQEITMLLFWPAQLGDLYTFTANGIHYDTDQKLAVVGVKHALAQGVGITTLTCRGTVAGAYAQWLKMQNFSTDVGPGLIAVTASFSSAGALVCSVNCESTVGSFKIAVDTSAYPTIATVRAATVHNGHAGDITFTGPYTGTVYVSVLAYGGANATGAESVKFDLQVTPGVVGPSLTVTPTASATQYSIAWTGTGGTVQLSINGGSYSSAPSSPIVVTRPAVGAVPLDYAFKLTAGGQTVTDTVSVMPIDSDTATPDLTVTPSSPADTTQTFTASATNPKSGGASPTITYTLVGCTAAGGTIAAGTYTYTTPVVVDRPAFGTAAQASITFKASISGGGAETIQRTILNQVKTSFGPTLTVTASPSSGSYSVAYTYTGTVTLSIDGGTYSTPAASPITVTRNAFGGASINYAFQCVQDGQTIAASVQIPPADALSLGLAVGNCLSSNAGATPPPYNQLDVTFNYSGMPTGTTFDVTYNNAVSGGMDSHTGIAMTSSPQTETFSSVTFAATPGKGAVTVVAKSAGGVILATAVKNKTYLT